MIAFALVLEPGDPLLKFRSLDEASLGVVQSCPLVPMTVRAISSAYTGKLVNACLVIRMAKDLEGALRAVTNRKDLTVSAMKWSEELVSPTIMKQTLVLLVDPDLASVL